MREHGDVPTDMILNEPAQNWTERKLW